MSFLYHALKNRQYAAMSGEFGDELPPALPGQSAIAPYKPPPPLSLPASVAMSGAEIGLGIWLRSIAHPYFGMFFIIDGVGSFIYNLTRKNADTVAANNTGPY